ncbi:tripartite motif-containing protein 16-like [Megalobrama amblycephala]|uniref:tripartite motif-containing protein 16-like n=1 Tax=Megalobrama amblycephala TaxID=75352 RepID=UPI00201417F1|nr:tripartite motif-containing protein 16-like [Megalobrama amblycephala]
MKFRVAVLLLLYKCLVFAPNVIFATESAVSGLPCPLKTCTDVLKELKDLEIRLAKSEDQIEEIKKEKQDLEIRLAKCEAQIEEIKKEKQDKDFVPRTRNDFLQYSRWLTLDLNTMNKYLLVSEGNRVITRTDTPQSYPDHPDRFGGGNSQVLCRESVSDRRSYWEIEWSGDVWISVSYKSICRKIGIESQFGSNDQSWSLICSYYRYSFRHNDIWTVLPVDPIISRTVNGKDYYRTGVYVDHSAGILFFYDVSGDTMILIHTVQTTFTQPLYPGIWVYRESSVKL